MVRRVEVAGFDGVGIVEGCVDRLPGFSAYFYPE